LHTTEHVVTERRPDVVSGWTCMSWTSDPLGGEKLTERIAPDPTGDPATTARSSA
jgi:hypothetical protein